MITQYFMDFSRFIRGHSRSILTLGGACVIISSIGLWYAQNLGPSEPMIQNVVKDVKVFFENQDRCDPFQCYDYIQIENVEKLESPVTLINSGGAKVQTIPLVKRTEAFDINSQTHIVEKSKVGIIESSVRIKGKYKQQYKKYDCQKGDYLLRITHRNQFYWPIDSLRVCFQIG